MAQNQNPRRFYIDRADDHAVVRAVPVQRTPRSPATHQIETPAPLELATSTPEPAIARSARRPAIVASRLAPKRVTNLVTLARNRAKHASS